MPPASTVTKGVKLIMWVISHRIVAARSSSLVSATTNIGSRDRGAPKIHRRLIRMVHLRRVSELCSMIDVYGPRVALIVCLNCEMRHNLLLRSYVGACTPKLCRAQSILHTLRKTLRCSGLRRLIAVLVTAELHRAGACLHSSWLPRIRAALQNGCADCWTLDDMVVRL